MKFSHLCKYLSIKQQRGKALERLWGVGVPSDQHIHPACAPKVKQISQTAKETPEWESVRKVDTSRLPHTTLQTRNSRYPMPCAACPLPPAPRILIHYWQLPQDHNTNRVLRAAHKPIVCMRFIWWVQDEAIRLLWSLCTLSSPRPPSSHPRWPRLWRLLISLIRFNAPRLWYKWFDETMKKWIG